MPLAIVSGREKHISVGCESTPVSLCPRLLIHPVIDVANLNRRDDPIPSQVCHECISDVIFQVFFFYLMQILTYTVVNSFRLLYLRMCIVMVYTWSLPVRWVNFGEFTFILGSPRSYFSAK